MLRLQEEATQSRFGSDTSSVQKENRRRLGPKRLEPERPSLPVFSGQSDVASPPTAEESHGKDACSRALHRRCSHRGGAVAVRADARHSAAGGRDGESQGSGAQDGGWQAGSLRHLANTNGEIPRQPRRRPRPFRFNPRPRASSRRDRTTTAAIARARRACPTASPISTRTTRREK